MACFTLLVPPSNAVYSEPREFQYGPRFGFAWNVAGNGKTAIRAVEALFL